MNRHRQTERQRKRELETDTERETEIQESFRWTDKPKVRQTDRPETDRVINRPIRE